MNRSAREEAEQWGIGGITKEGTQRFQGWAILDLADAIRETGEKIEDGLRGIEIAIVRYTEVVQNLD